MGKAGTERCFLKLTLNRGVKTQGSVKGVVVIIFWGGGRIDLCCLYANGAKQWGEGG